METAAREMVRVGSLRELREKGCVVVTGNHGPIAVFAHGGEEGPRVHAVDNRCPHMGFPLHRGSVHDGILTCHWHHARFDLSSGCTFDLFADDVPTYPVEIRGEEVWVRPYRDTSGEVERQKRRLVEGMEQNISLVIAKAVIALLNQGVDYREIFRIGVVFGARNRASGWASGQTILTAMANLCGHLPDEEQVLPLYQGLLHVARDCANQPPKRDLQPLSSNEVDTQTLKRWFRRFVEVRDPEGAERTLLTAIARGAAPREVADMMFAAATDHFFLDGGHVLDFINKGFEALELIGWSRASEVLPTLVEQLCRARRSEESQSWRHPVDLVPLLHAAFDSLDGRSGAGGPPLEPGSAEFGSLVESLLGESPEASVAALRSVVRDGVAYEPLARALAYAAALRICRFSTQNEFSDWIAVLHSFTYCNALHHALQRAPSPELARGIFHGAMNVYLNRFLNVPPARLPGNGPRTMDGEGGATDDGGGSEGGFSERFLGLLNTQQQVEPAAALVWTSLESGESRESVYRMFAQALLREDAEFHTFQMVEAAVRQHQALDDTREGRHALVAAARYLAAHSPTDRARQQTARIALRLHRGDALYEEEG